MRNNPYFIYTCLFTFLFLVLVFRPIEGEESQNVTFLKSSIPKNIGLIYYGAGGRRDWQAEDFEPYITYKESSTGKTFPLFDAFLLIEYRTTDGKLFWGGKNEEEVAKIEHWKGLAERWLSCLHSINECAGNLKSRSLLHQNIGVIITIPEPDVKCTNFGTLPDSNTSLNFQKPEDRQKAIRWYIEQVCHHIEQAKYEHLDFIGFYWLAESITNEMIPTVKETAKIVHERGLNFFWIPFFTGNNIWVWKELGFDYMFLQPNYFFNGDGGNRRLPLAGYRIQQFQCGAEMELDDRILTSEPHQLRFLQYLQAGSHFQWNTKPMAWYQSNDTIYQLATSKDEKLYEIYRNIVHFINNDYQPLTSLPPIEEYKIPDRSGKNWAHKNNGTKVTEPSSGFCLSLNPEWIIDGDIDNYSGTSGFGCCGIPGEITLLFPEAITLSRIQLLLFNLDERYYQYRIELSEDGQNWETVIDKTQGEYRNWQVDIISPHTARYLRVIPTYNSAKQSLFQIVELEAY